jgi:hypothetical protein
MVQSPWLFVGFRLGTEGQRERDYEQQRGGQQARSNVSMHGEPPEGMGYRRLMRSMAVCMAF